MRISRPRTPRSRFRRPHEVVCNPVVDERREPRLAYSDMLERHRVREALEQALAAAEDDRGNDDPQLVDDPRRERLADDVGSAHDMDILLAGRMSRLLDGFLDA